MNVFEYCRTVVTELESWRKRLAVLDNRIALCQARGGIKGDVEELHMVIAEIDNRVHALRNACPLSLRPFSGAEGVGPVTINWDAALKTREIPDAEK
ncbi:MAG: hypothetical protein ACOY32_14845 [Thermodesulfobacteriota bacterium]